MKCFEVQEKLTFYVDGALDEYTLEAVEAHLAGCAECRKELASLRAMVSAAADIRELEPPSSLKQRILAAVPQDALACSQASEMLSGYLDGELMSADAEAVGAHTANCHQCSQELKALRVLANAAAEVVSVEPPAGLRVRIAAATVGSKQPLPVMVRVQQALLTPAFRFSAGAATAVCAVLAIVAAMTPAPTVHVQTARRAPAPTAVAIAPTAPVVREPVIAAVPVPARAESGADSVVVRHRNRVRGTAPRELIATAPKQPAHPKQRIVPATVDSTADEDQDLDRLTALRERAEPEVAVASTPDVPEAEVTPAPPKPTRVASVPEINPSDLQAVVKRAKMSVELKRGSRFRGLRLLSSRF